MDDVTACVLCGRYVLQVPGWTMQIRAYDMFRSPWDEDQVFLGDGSLHFSCLRNSVHRDQFRADALELFTSYDHQVMIEVQGRPEAVNRIGKAFVEHVFSDNSGDLFRHANIDEWVFVEREGPLQFLGPEDIAMIQRGEVPRKSTGALTTLLPHAPNGPVERWPFSQLLEFLGITDLYQGALDRLRPEYECWEYADHNPKFFLDYSVDCDVRLPEALTRFLAGYSYRPRSDDWE